MSRMTTWTLQFPSMTWIAFSVMKMSSLCQQHTIKYNISPLSRRSNRDKVRLYDIRTKNCKPVLDFECTHVKRPLNNIVLNPNNDSIYVSDIDGGIYNLDTKKGSYWDKHLL